MKNEAIQHTAGPWELEDRDTRLVIRADGFHDEIASFDLVFDGADDEAAEAAADEQRANAQVAVTAPKMLAALERLCNYQRPGIWDHAAEAEKREMWKQALDAIAEARGLK